MIYKQEDYKNGFKIQAAVYNISYLLITFASHDQ